MHTCIYPLSTSLCTFAQGVISPNNRIQTRERCYNSFSFYLFQSLITGIWFLCFCYILPFFISIEFENIKNMVRAHVRHFSHIYNDTPNTPKDPKSSVSDKDRGWKSRHAERRIFLVYEKSFTSKIFLTTSLFHNRKVSRSFLNNCLENKVL